MLRTTMSPSSSSFLVPLNPRLSTIARHNLPHISLFAKHSLSFSKSHLCYASSSSSSNSNSAGSDRDGLLWLREEQRWLREEQRWLREEQRWFRERESLLNEIHSLKVRIQALEERISVAGADSVPDAVASVAPLLQVPKERSLIPESGSSASPIVLEETEEEAETTAASVEPVVVVEVKEEKKKKARRALKTGSEGEDVQEMQEALLELGFYSGEEDMEFSYFSDGTERAVKTWQATLSIPEDGVMSTELLERLYMLTRTDVVTPEISTDKKTDENRSHFDVQEKEDSNGAAVAGISERQQKVVKEEGATEAGVSKHRVFLLGENRWEEPSRLVGRNKETTANNVRKTIKCLTCRDEGRLMCTECDGTGEPNIEPQFLEWIGEDTKCAYCNGQGFTSCDVCEGK